MSSEFTNGSSLTGSNKAWHLMIGEGMQIAVSDYEMIEYVIDPQLYPVPLAQAHCSNVMLWLDHIIPVMDFLVLFDKPSIANANVILAIVAYQVKPLEPLQYVGLLIQQPPSRVTAENDQACALPASDNNFWESTELALACFSYDDIPTPIINVAHLCSTAFRETVTAISHGLTSSDNNSDEPVFKAV